MRDYNYLVVVPPGTVFVIALIFLHIMRNVCLYGKIVNYGDIKATSTLVIFEQSKSFTRPLSLFYK